MTFRRARTPDALRLTLALPIFVLALSCESSEPSRPSAGEGPETSTSTPAEWEPGSSYTYELDSSCGERSLIGEFRIEVRDGEVSSVEPLDESARSMIEGGFEDDIPSIEELLTEARLARSEGADVVEVRRADDGRPTEIEIDYMKEAIDDEACYVIRRFRSLASESAECDAPENDLSKEPNYKVDYIHRWTTNEGCDVRLDVLMTRQLSDHCSRGGGEHVADILMGTPLGESHENSAPRIYIKDPTNFLGDEQTANGYEADASLPQNAEDTGYRQDGTELWITPDDDRSIYLAAEGRVERWPQDDSPPGCG
jgi:Family of unknown function (DUF6174)